MSSILKALKKLEDEKVSHQPDSLMIDSDILRSENPHRHSASFIITAALLLFAGGSIATYLYMKQDFSISIINAIKKPGEMSRINQPVLRTPVPNEAEVKTNVLPDIVEIVPAKRSGADKVITPKRPKRAAPAKPVQPDVPRINLQARQLEDHKNIVTPTATPAPVVANTVPVLRVNGIAYQDGTTDNVAIVNGEPVSTGSMIEGTKVEAILKNRIRFNYKGEVFFIPLGKSNR